MLDFVTGKFGFQRREEALHGRIVPDVARPDIQYRGPPLTAINYRGPDDEAVDRVCHGARSRSPEHR